ncbi:formate--tetrahydrofolate ligase [Pseudostreptobacillus hongkongensis]|uniref:formate--tetrahydrofolate ligase n=1 Tax=Pseudostreptobacillus hongkongensis TaxID=1162717 RepID=UPI0028D6DBEF|nr:formate--tetrahydrofolate ligase [Pseudostreptobacillus hongkongensis]
MTDIEIAQKAILLPIEEIAKKIGVEEYIEQYGKYKAKIDLSILDDFESKANGKLILVTAISPTPYGEGKTTVTVGLTQGFNKLGYNSIAALREPSMGPVFGLKGGATGGGYSQVLPMEDINLHFTGDFHAITSANNLIAASIDNHLNRGNELEIDIDNIYFKRVLDMNDRALREITIGKGRINGPIHEASFKITVASEIMAIFCLSENIHDLKEKIGNIIIGKNIHGDFVFVKDLKIEGACAVLLKDAIKPNLVQTIENTPVLIHGGPFANIAHGCNSILATKMALKLSDYTITEAGFASDLGAEKFFDIKCRKAHLTPDLVVIVATVRALKYHGNDDVEKGLVNLEKHIENMKKFNLPIVVAINKFTTDTDEEINSIQEFTEKLGVKSIPIDIHAKGGIGSKELVEDIVETLDKIEDIPSEEVNSVFEYLYPLDASIEEKIEILCKEIYDAGDIEYSEKALEKIRLFTEKGYSNLPICMSKTPASISDNPKLLGRPQGYTFKITDINISAGAGFLVIMSGDILDMPGLPKVPAAEKIDIDENGNIVGLS